MCTILGDIPFFVACCSGHDDEDNKIILRNISNKELSSMHNKQGGKDWHNILFLFSLTHIRWSKAKYSIVSIEQYLYIRNWIICK